MLEILTLGGLQIRLDGCPLGDLKSRRAEALLAYLACTGRPQAREVLLDLFWDAPAAAQARGNLRWLVAVLRQRLAAELDVTRSTLALHRAHPPWLDVAELERQHAAGRSGSDARLSPVALAALEAAVALYHGPFLHGFYLREAPGFEAWMLREQERYQALILTALDALVAHYLAAELPAPGLAHARRRLALDPLHEAAYRQTMRLLALAGQRSAVGDLYALCRHTLADELGLAPEPATTALYEQLRATAPPTARAPDPAPAASLPAGVPTLLAADIVDQTRLWDQQEAAMTTAVARLDALLRRVARAQGGTMYRSTGGAFGIAFAGAPSAVRAAVAAQQTLAAQPGGSLEPLHVRMALHSGPLAVRGQEYFGPATLNRLAQLLAVTPGRYILLTAATAARLAAHPLPGITLRDLGAQRLPDLRAAEQIFQVAAPGLPELPPLLPGTTHPHNLPASATSFVERIPETTAALALLRRPGVRLVTFTGPGGTGKTRLSLRVAQELLPDFPNGVWFVPLGALRDPALVVSALAQVLDVREAGGQTLGERVAAALGPRHTLLVFDNFEQVTEAAPLLTRLLAAAPGLQVLVTSRVRLHLYGEYDLAVPPMALPDPRHLPPLAELAAVPAIRLFVERTLAAKADFALTPENAAAVAALCARVDGLPLAIELAAARIRLFTPQALLARLDNRFQLLTGGPQDLPARQRTLRATIDWSYDLLTPAEQVLFQRVAVFADGWTLDAAETICDLAPADPEPPLDRPADRRAVPGPARLPALDVVDGLAALVDKSLVRQQDSAVGTPRFGMLETIRQYAEERLAGAGAREPLRARHAAYYLARAETARGAPTAEQTAWQDELALDHDNLRAALDWALTREAVDCAARLAVALRDYWDRRGHWSEGRRWLHAVLAQQHRLPPALRAEALAGAAWLAVRQSDTIQATSYLEQSLALYREVGQEQQVMSLLNQLGVSALYAGAYARAQAFFTQCLALAQPISPPHVLTYRANLATVALFQGALAEARRLAEEILAAPAADRSTVVQAQTCGTLGVALLLQGEVGRAREVCAAGLAAAQEARHTLMILYCLPGYAAALGLQGEGHAAACLFGAIEARHTSLEWTLPPGLRPVYERLVAQVRARVDPATWDAGFAAGRGLTLDALVAEALAPAGGPALPTNFKF